MGIHNLSKVIGDHAPGAVREHEIKSYFGRKVAIDASMSIYQFLIAVRSEGNVLMNEDGDTTSHLMGMFYRTIRMVDNGIKPVYVFDGKPPAMKSGELAKRHQRRQEAEKSLAEAEEKGDAENIERFNKRLTKVTPQHNDEVKQLLKLMGIPYVSAPCEAEAQCAHLVKHGKVFAVGTEDMDALTFGSNVLLRHLTFSEARKMPIQEFNYDRIIQEMQLTTDQFVDLCILLGCDYCDSIRGIGQKKAYDLIKQYKTIEEVLEHLDTKKYTVPEDWMFKLKWTEPDEEGLVEFMCKGKGFNEDRIRNGVKKLGKARTTTTQVRMDSFFKVTSVTKSSTAEKRKSDTQKGSAKKKGRGGGFRRGK
ncbi:flap endonuclease 1-like isoform X2 [Lineus longissimus]|uniref:flap endonuclease 1-like isoform X2 n=1 Tax=Lineus longissimus TaxID=88925 RepID=UPI00315CB4BA